MKLKTEDWLLLGAGLVFLVSRTKAGTNTTNTLPTPSSGSSSTPVPSTMPSTTPSTSSGTGSSTAPLNLFLKLKLGSSGQEVRTLQTKLNDLLAKCKTGFSLSPTTIWCRTQNPIVVDGQFGPATQLLLYGLFKLTEIYLVDYPKYETNFLSGSSGASGGSSTPSTGSSNLNDIANDYIAKHQQTGGTGRCAIYKRVVELSDSDIRSLNTIIKQKDAIASRGLRRFYNSTWYNDCPLDGVNWGVAMISKLDSLGL